MQHLEMSVIQRDHTEAMCELQEKKHKVFPKITQCREQVIPIYHGVFLEQLITP